MSEEREDFDEDLLEGSRCANCGEQWRVEADDRPGAMRVWQARCTNGHGCGLRGPRNHFWEKAADEAERLGLYVDQRAAEQRLALRVAGLEAEGKRRDAQALAVRRELQAIARHVQALAEKLEEK